MSSPVTSPSTAPEPRAVSRAVLDLIMEFSVSLHKHTIYPTGHPLIDDAVRTLHAKLDGMLADRPSLAIGVTPSQLIVAGAPTDPSNALAREFAGKLHRRNVGALKFTRGLEPAELGEALSALARDTLGAGERTWPHVRVFPLTYDQLRLEHDDYDPTESDEPAGLWLDLARSALEQDGRAESEVLTDPLLVARAIEARGSDPAVGRRVVDYLAEFSAASRARGGADIVAGQRFVSAMVGSLSPDALKQLLQFKPEGRERRDFVVGTSQVVAVETVVELARAAAELSEQTISPPLLRLFSKLADHAGRGNAAARAAAADTLRTQVTEWIDGWAIPGHDGSNEHEYQQLAGVVAARTGDGGEGTQRSQRAEPERILQMSIELRHMSASASAAADRLVVAGRVPWLLELLAVGADGETPLAEVRSRIVSAETVRDVVARRPIDFEALCILTDALWSDAGPPLLDALAAEEDRTTRRRLLELLEKLGQAIGPEVVARLEGGEWYVQRNMLAILNALPESPAGFSAAPFLKHEDARVRHEAIKLLLRDPVTRDRAICDGLGSPDERTRRAVLNAAVERCPSPAVPLLIRQITESRLDASLAPMAVRAIGQSAQPGALECLLQLTLARKILFRRQRLLAKSPVLLAALAGLAGRWRVNPRAAVVIAIAAAHADADIRSAVEPAAGATA